MKTFEINEMANCRRDSVNKNLHSTSPIVETFSALVKGESIENIKDTNGVKCGDRCVTAIKELNNCISKSNEMDYRREKDRRERIRAAVF